MGKKGKKGKGKGKGKRGKKKDENQMTWREALLAYRINIQEKALEDLRYEVRGLEDKKQRLEEKREKLQMEQHEHIRKLLKRAKEFEVRLAEEEDTTKEQVITMMMEKWEAAKVEDAEIAEMKRTIALTDVEIEREADKLSKWQDYKENGLEREKLQEVLLEKELNDMQSNFDEMSGYLQKTLDHAKDEINQEIEERLDKQKYLASERAIAKMDKHSRQEVSDNDWLKKETEIHGTEAANVQLMVERLERENLEIMSELFECTVDDLKISRDFYLTQFAENSDDNPEKGLLEIDLSKLRLDSAPTRKPLETKNAPDFGSLVPWKQPSSVEDAIAGTSDDVDVEHYDGDNGLNSDDEDPFKNYLQQEDEYEFNSYMQLGPLELKLLNVRGRQIRLLEQKNPTQEQEQAENFAPIDWPVNNEMLKQAVSR